MNNDLDREAALRRYVLGQADEVERARVEDAIFSSGDVFEEVEAIETEVVDEYVGGELAAADRASLEHQLTRSRTLAEKVVLARQFRERGRSVTAVAAARRRWTAGWMPIAAGLVLAGAATAVFLLRDGMPSHPPTVATVPAEPVAAAPPAAGGTPAVPPTGGPPAVEARPPRQPAVIANIVLAASVLRSGAVPVLAVKVPAADGVVRTTLLLEPGDERPSYVAALAPDDGEAVWTSAALRAARSKDGPVVIADVPATRLKTGIYQVILSARTQGRVEELGAYRFRVVR